MAKITITKITRNGKVVYEKPKIKITKICPVCKEPPQKR